MHYLLYLRKSLTRSPRRHISLYLIFTCAFLLPLLVSILRDSSIYGTSQMLLAQSKGQTFHIQNVTEEDCQYFTGLIGLSDPVYEDGTIYLKITDDADWKDVHTFDTLGWKIEECIENAGLNAAVVTAYNYNYAHGISEDAADIADKNILLAINIALILFPALIVQSSYQNHLRRFSADMKTLTL